MNEPVEYENVTIDGDLDLTNLNLELIPVKRSEKEVKVWNLEENLRLVTSRIKLTNSEITGFVNFAYCIFKNEVNIQSTDFKKDFYVNGSQFRESIKFDNSEFSGDVDFQFAKFNNISFDHARFNKDARFNFVKFNLAASFNTNSFSGDVGFIDATFLSQANFNYTQFIKGASLGGAQFKDNAVFVASQFGGPVDFSGTEFQSEADFVEAQFKGDVSFVSAQFLQSSSFLRAQFLSSNSFSSAQFHEFANFDHVKFDENANFTGAKFSKDATFRGSLFIKSFIHLGTEFYGSIDITDADFGNIDDRLYLSALIREGKSDINSSTDVGVENAAESESSDAESELQATSINKEYKTELDPNPIEIAADILADRNETDLLGFSDYADALTDFIRNKKPEEALIIGIDAAWGVGKTKLMEMIRDNLTGSSNRVVWFNAWKYDQEKSLWSALVLEILAQIRNKSGPLQRLVFLIKLNYKRVDQNFVYDLVKWLASIISLILLGYVIFTGLSLVSDLIASSENELLLQLNAFILILEQFKAVSVLGFAAILFVFAKGIYTHFIGPFDLKIDRYVQEPDYKERVGFLAKFEKDFECVIELVTKNGENPLVVFIDDLDRCTPPKPADIIEAINVLLDANHCTFIIGMDSQAVAASIEAKYKDLKECYYDSFDSTGLTLGQRFLEKIIQINFRIPRADKDMMVSFVDAHLGGPLSGSSGPPNKKTPEKEVKEVVELIDAETKRGKSPDEAIDAVQKARPEASQEVIKEARMRRNAEKLFENSDDVRHSIYGAVPYLGSNPRKIKRFINLFRLMALIANRRGLLDRKIIRLDSLAKWVVITMRWPQMIEILASDQDFVHNLRTRASPKDPYISRIIEKSAIDAKDFLELMKDINEEELHYYLHLAETTVERPNR
jgi:hypothetical protein